MDKEDLGNKDIDSLLSTKEEPADSPVDKLASIASGINVVDNSFSEGIKENPSKKKKLIVLGVFLTVLAACSVYWFGFRPTTEEVVQTQAENQVQQIGMSLALVEGKVEYSDNEGVLWQIAKTDTELGEGLWLRTSDSEQSRAIVSYEDGSALRLDKGTQVSLDVSNTGYISLNLVKGRAYARVADPGVQVFEVKTQKIVAEALGTAFAVSYQNNLSTIEVFESIIKEKQSGVEVKEGSRFTEDGTGETKVVDLNTEEAKEDPFILWNREQDLLDPMFKNKLGFLEDFEPPDLNITSPVNNAKITIPIGSTNVNLDVSGSTEPGAAVKVSGSDASVQEVTADETGAFKVTMNGREGRVAYLVESTDRNGNISKLTVEVEFEQEVEEADVLDITLGAVAEPVKGVVLNWTFRNGFEAPDGVKVLWSKPGNLTYPVELSYGGSLDLDVALATNSSQISPAIEDPCLDDVFGSKLVASGNTTTVCLFGGSSYAFRVCRYDSATDTCDKYSNEVRVSAPGGSD